MPCQTVVDDEQSKIIPSYNLIFFKPHKNIARMDDASIDVFYMCVTHVRSEIYHHCQSFSVCLGKNSDEEGRSRG